MASPGKFRRFIWLFVMVLIALVVGGVVFYRTERQEPPQYTSAPVTRGDLTQAVTANGQLNPVLNVQVGSQISGNIAKLYADYNSLVKSNQIVAELDSSIYKATVRQAEADLANAQAAKELSQVEAKRSEALVKDKLISQSDYDKAFADLHQAEAQVAMKAASLERAKVDLGHCTIYAPVDGIVILRSVDVGQTVAASMNAPVLFQIANDLAKMQIDANVSEADVGTVEEGQDTTFTVDAYPLRTFKGKVVQIRNSPITVQNVVTYDTVIGVTNSDFKLKPGMTATISIITAQRTNALKVPNAALRFKPPEPPTNSGFVAVLFEKLGLAKSTKTGATNSVASTKSSTTNKVETAEGAPPPLTGNEPPPELQRRVREMRDKGETVPPEIMAKMRELYQSGVLQRPSGGGGPGGGGGQQRQQRTAPAFRTLYVLRTNTPPGATEPIVAPEPVRVRTGVNDGSYTEIMEGLKEGDQVVIGIKASASSSSAPPPGGSSPFGGGSGGMRRF